MPLTASSDMSAAPLRHSPQEGVRNPRSTGAKNLNHPTYKSYGRSPVTAPRPQNRSSNAPVIISLQNVSKIYSNKNKALDNVNWQVRKGDFWFVTGPSGAGKSTLLKLLYGAEKCCKGDLTVNNCIPSKLRNHQLSMLTVKLGWYSRTISSFPAGRSPKMWHLYCGPRGSLAKKSIAV